MLTFWGTALFVPLLVIVGNAFVRWLFKLEPSSFADVILMFVVFDVLIITEHSNVAPYIRNATLKDALEFIYSILLIFNMFIWIIAAFRVEKKLSAAYDNEAKWYVRLPWIDLAQSWGLSAFVFFANLATFAYRG